MTASELKQKVEESKNEPYFFTRKTMQFFGDTMKNYGVRVCYVTTNWAVDIKCYELYRRHPIVCQQIIALAEE